MTHVDVPRLTDPSWRQRERDVDQSDYDWQMSQVGDDDDEILHCPVCGSNDIGDDGECLCCLTVRR